MKKILMLLLVSIIFITGCTQAAVTIPSASAPVTVSSSSPSTRANPIPIDPMVEKLALAPEIDGLTKEIREKDGIQKVVYLYKADNPYGGKTGEYAGEYRQNIIVSASRESGNYDCSGVLLASNVVKEMLILSNGNGLSSLPVCAIPLDVTSLDSNDVINVYFKYDVDGNNMKSITVDFDGTIPLVCMGFGMEDIKPDYVIGSLHGNGEKLCLFDIIFKNDLAYESGHVRSECITRMFNFEGGLEIDVASLELYDEKINNVWYAVGQFNYGEKICDVTDKLVIFNRNEFNIGRSLIIGDNNLVFTCQESD
ncbi:MAG: hypothetical protein Q8O09_02150 [Bacillota bacterium]|nr:hypothetical protein [Bacillota bacterium]